MSTKEIEARCRSLDAYMREIFSRRAEWTPRLKVSVLAYLVYISRGDGTAEILNFRHLRKRTVDFHTVYLYASVLRVFSDSEHSDSSTRTRRYRCSSSTTKTCFPPNVLLRAEHRHKVLRNLKARLKARLGHLHLRRHPLLLLESLPLTRSRPTRRQERRQEQHLLQFQRHQPVLVPLWWCRWRQAPMRMCTSTALTALATPLTPIRSAVRHC